MEDDCSGVCGRKCYNFIYYGNTIFSGVCLLIALALAGIQIIRHLQHYTNPHFQNKILSIIFAAPFYGTMSYLTIVTKDNVGFWILLRSIYDSVLCYFFFNLITSYVVYDQGKLDMDLMYEAIYEKGEIPHSFPINCFYKSVKISDTNRAKFFYRVCKNNILQFYVISALITLINCIIAMAGGPALMIIITNFVLLVSATFCVYYLVLFYQAIEAEIKPYRPLLKFLAVKGIIFFTFWQEIAIEAFQGKLLALFNKCKIEDFKPHYIINSASCMLVCFEMIILTIVTNIAFSYRDFQSVVTGPLKKRLIINVLKDNFKEQMKDISEFDVIKHLPFQKTRPVQINEKELTTTYVDKKGEVVDAEDEVKAKLFQSQIHIIPDAIPMD